jgi:hypothetical protein
VGNRSNRILKTFTETAVPLLIVGGFIISVFGLTVSASFVIGEDEGYKQGYKDGRKA